ncbi:unnamed protein product [Phytomonas sp. EM1]|nr:unnamed protein product [Phytomonas sp. EM1]|eukprot:CCW63397.1 unnamed protein product [Phytomonas sp. isolate EM1]
MKCAARMRVPLSRWRPSSFRSVTCPAALAPSSCVFFSAATFCSHGSCPLRRYATSSDSTEKPKANKVLSKKGMNGFTDVNYNRAADDFLERIEVVLDELVNDNIRDINLSDGVLTIETTQGTFLFNKQAPNLQLWLSSPISGPHHYDMVEGAQTTSPQGEGASRVRWVCECDGHDLKEKVQEEFSEVLGIKLVL